MRGSSLYDVWKITLAYVILKQLSNAVLRLKKSVSLLLCLQTRFFSQYLKTFKKALQIYLKSFNPSFISSTGLFLTIINVLISYLSWILLSNMFRGNQLIIEKYEMDFKSFLVWGVIANNLFIYTSLFKRFPYFFYDNIYKRLVMSRTRPLSFWLLNRIISFTIGSLYWMIFQLIVVTIFYNIKFPDIEGFFIGIFALALGFIAESFFLIIVKSLPIFFSKLRYYPSIIAYIVQVISIAVSSIYYPIEILPAPLRSISPLFPRSLAIQCMRLGLILKPETTNYLLLLLAETLILSASSYYVLIKVKLKAEKEGLKYLRP